MNDDIYDDDYCHEEDEEKPEERRLFQERCEAWSSDCTVTIRDLLFDIMCRSKALEKRVYRNDNHLDRQFSLINDDSICVF